MWRCLARQTCQVLEETAASVTIHPDDGGSRLLWITGTLNTTRLNSATSQKVVNFYRHCLKDKTEIFYKSISWLCAQEWGAHNMVIFSDFHNVRNLKHVNYWLWLLPLNANDSAELTNNIAELRKEKMNVSKISTKMV